MATYNLIRMPMFLATALRATADAGTARRLPEQKTFQAMRRAVSTIYPRRKFNRPLAQERSDDKLQVAEKRAITSIHAIDLCQALDL